QGRLPTCYSPVRRSLVIQRQFSASTSYQLGQCARLACIRHTAGVHPEPGSNSHIKYKNLNSSNSN
ncbi:hypothetical protein HMPREF0549_1547, partial [Limosilactobacillus vaginalis DSM 5837 = ATCC 49540]